MWKQLELKESISRFSGRIVLFGLLHFIFCTFLAIVLSLSVGRLTPWISIVSLILGSVAAWFGSGVFKGDSVPKFKKLGIFESVIYLFILIAGLMHFGYMFFSEQQWYFTLLRYNIGDLPLHISYIRHMSAGGQFPPADPVWAFDNLRYPFGMDLYNAMWDTIGLHVQTHLFFTGFILLVLSVVLLRWWGGVLLVGSFFLSGAWVGWECVSTLKVEDYLHNVLIKNFFLQHFLTQRGFLISIPLGAFVLKTAYDHIKGSRVLSTKQTLLFGLMWGSIAFFHLHSFVVVSLLIGSTFVLYGKWKVSKVASMLAVAVPLGIIVIGYLTNWLSGSGDKPLFEIDLGWYATKDQWGGPNLVNFWWFNMGLWLLFVVGVFMTEIILWLKRIINTSKSALRPQRTNLLAEWMILAGWFVFFNIVMIGAWDRDNNLKFMIWLYLGMIALASSRMSKLLRGMQDKITVIKKKPWIGKAGLAALYTVLFFSGIVCVLATILPHNKGFFVYDRLEVNRVKKAVDGVSPDAVFAAKDTYNHPLSYWGHKVVMGFDGHIWSHGYDYTDVQRKLVDLYAPRSDWETIVKELGVDYIFRGPWERHYFRDNRTDWQIKLENISPDPQYEVYRVNK